MRTYLAAFIAAALASLLLTRWIREFARNHGWVDYPDSSRKLHTEPIPRVGGVAIYLSLWVSIGLIALLSTTPSLHFRGDFKRVLLKMGLAGLVLLIGLWDDIKGLKPWKKFSLEVAVAVICWTAGYRILSGWTIRGDEFSWGWLSLPLTVLWIVAITNAFNLIDGIDGLSSGAALFATISLLIVSVGTGRNTAILLLAALAGATLGFLRYNFNPASIFLGDSGSLLLGFMLALLSLAAYQKSTAAFTIAVPLVAFGLPVLDTAIVVMRRFLSGKPIFTGDRRHIHHVLIQKGFTPRKAVILLYGVCGFFGLISLLFLNPQGGEAGLVLAILGLCVWLAIQQLHYPELRELNAHFARGIQNQRKLIAGSVAVGKLLDGIKKAQTFSGLLETLSMGLEDMEFSYAELRLPQLNGCPNASDERGWHVRPDGSSHCLYQWHSRVSSEAEPLTETDGHDQGFSASDHFKIEFGFEFAENKGKAYSSASQGIEAVAVRHKGRITFYHSTQAEYPVSAISLLSRNVWHEFEDALERCYRTGPKKRTPAVGVLSAKEVHQVHG